MDKYIEAMEYSIPKEMIDRADAAEYVDYVIKKVIPSELAHRILEIVSAEKRIVVDFSEVIRIDEPHINSIAFRQCIEWKPIGRCVDCKYHDAEEPGMVYCSKMIDGWIKNDFFCAIWEAKQ